MNLNKIITFVKKNNSQSHLCICNSGLFDITIFNGLYGFPHSGYRRNKSFWRSLSSMYNIGVSDLLFFYRKNGNQAGCQEIHGPFKIHDIDSQPSIYYDLGSKDFDMRINDETDCKVRFLFSKFENEVCSIADKFEVIKKFEFRDLWGYRHPSVMNIGSARKKSVTAFTNKQTLVFLELLEKCGVVREYLNEEIPVIERIKYFNEIKPTDYLFRINSDFLASNFSEDEAYLYSYFISALKNKINYYSSDVLKDFSIINNELLNSGKLEFKELFNVMLEVIVTTHLQDELDVILTDKEDRAILAMEFKVGILNQKDIDQIEKYLDLFNAIYPDKMNCANLIGRGKEAGIKISNRFKDKIKLVEYSVVTDFPVNIRFTDITG